MSEPTTEMTSVSGRFRVEAFGDQWIVTEMVADEHAVFADLSKARRYVEKALNDEICDVEIPTDFDEAIAVVYTLAGHRPDVVLACDLIKYFHDRQQAQIAAFEEQLPDTAQEPPTVEPQESYEDRLDRYEPALADLRAGDAGTLKEIAERHGVDFAKLRSAWALECKRARDGAVIA